MILSALNCNMDYIFLWVGKWSICLGRFESIRSFIGFLSSPRPPLHVLLLCRRSFGYRLLSTPTPGNHLVWSEILAGGEAGIFLQIIVLDANHRNRRGLKSVSYVNYPRIFDVKSSVSALIGACKATGEGQLFLVCSSLHKSQGALDCVQALSPRNPHIICNSFSTLHLLSPLDCLSTVVWYGWLLYYGDPLFSRLSACLARPRPVQTPLFIRSLRSNFF